MLCVCVDSPMTVSPIVRVWPATRVWSATRGSRATKAWDLLIVSYDGSVSPILRKGCPSQDFLRCLLQAWNACPDGGIYIMAFLLGPSSSQ